MQDENVKTEMAGVKTHRLASTPVNKLLIEMSVPMIISMFMQACYNIVDSIYVSRISEDALSALSLAYAVQFLMIALNVGTSVGVTALISRSLGEKNYDNANDYARHGIFISTIYTILFMFFGFFAVSKYYNFITNDAEIIYEGISYLSIITIFSQPFFYILTFEKMMQATGKTFQSMITQLTGAIINIILDPILIFGMFGLPALGSKGAAIATVAGQFIGLILAIILNRIYNTDIKIELYKFKLSLEKIKNIYRIGLPSIIMQSLNSVVIFGLNRILISYRSQVAIIGIFHKFISFVYMPLFGLNNGMIPIVSYNFGAKNEKRVVDTIKFACILATGIMFIGTLIFLIFPDKIFMLFAADDHMMREGVKAFRIVSLHFIFAGANIILATAMQSCKREIYGLITEVFRQLVILLPVSYFLSLKIGPNGVWFGYIISELLSLILTSSLFMKTYKEEIKPLSNNA